MEANSPLTVALTERCRAMIQSSAKSKAELPQALCKRAQAQCTMAQFQNLLRELGVAPASG